MNGFSLFRYRYYFTTKPDNDEQRYTFYRTADYVQDESLPSTGPASTTPSSRRELENQPPQFSLFGYGGLLL